MGESRVRLLAKTKDEAQLEAKEWEEANSPRKAKLTGIREVKPDEGGYGVYLYIATFTWTEPKQKTSSKGRRKK